MRNLLALVGAAVVGFGGVGWYMGWYKLSYARTLDGNIQVSTTVHSEKVVKDVNEGAKHLGALAGEQLDKAQTEAKAAAVPTPGTTPGPVTIPAPTPTPTPPVPPAPPPQVKAPEHTSWLYGWTHPAKATKK